MKSLAVHILINLSVFLGSDLYVQDGANTRALLNEFPTDMILANTRMEIADIRYTIHGNIFSVERSVVGQRSGRRFD